MAEILRAVERGEGFAITRDGKSIARLVPAAGADRTVRREALERFCAKRAQLAQARFSIQEILDARHEDH